MNKRVLIIGPDFYNYCESISDGFVYWGYETKIIKFKEVYGIANKIRYLFEFKKSKSIKNKSFVNKEILKIYEEFKPDIIFVLKGTVIYSETLRKIKKSKKILWMIDSCFKYPSVMKTFKDYDNIFMFEENDVKELEKNGIISYFLPMGYDDNIFFPIKCKKDIDIIFVGDLSDDRLHLLYKVIDNFKEKRIEIYGKRIFIKNKPLKYFCNKNIFKNKRVTPEELNILYNRSKVCLNIHKRQSKLSVNPRFFEICATGSVQVVDSKEYIVKNSIGNHIVFYTENDLIEKINLAFKYTDLSYCDEIKEHTFKNRVKYILSKI